MPETRPCELPDCGRPRYQNKPYCASHFMKKYRYGDPYYKAPSRAKDLTGQRFGQLVVIHREDDGKWLCQCDCGGRLRTRVGDLNRGGAKSCGDKLVHKRQEIVGYWGAHDRVSAAYGSAKLHDCADCGQAAKQWSYNHQDPDEQHEWLSWGGSCKPWLVGYSISPEYYVARCNGCHRRFDQARGRQRRALEQDSPRQAEIQDSRVSESASSVHGEAQTGRLRSLR